MSAWDMPGRPVRSWNAPGKRERLSARDIENPPAAAARPPVEEKEERPPREAAPPPPGPPRDGFFDPRALLALILRRDLTIAVIAAVFSALALAAIYFIPFPFKASAIVFIDPRDEKVTLQQEVLPAIGTDAAVLESMVRVVGSDGFLIDLLERLKLLPNGASWTGSVDDLKALAKFRKAVTAERMGATYLVEISAKDRSGAEAARIANGVATAFAETQNGSRSRATENSVRTLSDRLVEIRSKVNASEEAVARFKADNDIVYLDEQNTVQTRQLSDISQQLAAIKSAAEEAQARYDESKTTGTYTRTPGQTDEESEQLSYLRRQRAALMQQRDQQTLTYGPRHPRLAETQHMIDGLDAQIAQQRQRMVGQLKSERDVNAEKQAQLENQVRELAKSISRTDAAKVQLAALEREATANRELYQQLLSRNKETYELALLPNDNVRIVSAAVAPLVSTRPPMILVAPAVVVLGIIAAIFLVVLMELKSLRRAR